MVVLVTTILAQTLVGYCIRITHSALSLPDYSTAYGMTNNPHMILCDLAIIRVL